ncbi:MAG: SMC-Scp complex subunit ScpB [Cyanobacteria bacterium P01_C01_bin.89]
MAEEGLDVTDTNSTDKSLTGTLEAVLYLRAQPVSLAELVDYTGEDREDIEAALVDLMMDYVHRNGALEVVEADRGYSLQLRESYTPFIEKLVPSNIGVGALRTLAVVALKGPLPQSELVEIRGSGAYQQVHDLVDQGFVKRRRLPSGRSFSVQVTDKFRRYFQLDTSAGDNPEQLSLVLKSAREMIAASDSEDAEASETVPSTDSEVVNVGGEPT